MTILHSKNSPPSSEHDNSLTPGIESEPGHSSLTLTPSVEVLQVTIRGIMKLITSVMHVRIL